MTEERREEIALLVVEQLAIEQGIPGGSKIRRDAGNMAKRIGITYQEAMDFYQSFAPKILGRAFGQLQVSIQMGTKENLQ